MSSTTKTIKVKLYKFIIDFENKKLLQRNMIEESKEKVESYIKTKFRTDKFIITQDEEVGVRIK